MFISAQSRKMWATNFGNIEQYDAQIDKRETQNKENVEEKLGTVGLKIPYESEKFLNGKNTVTPSCPPSQTNKQTPN